jgi:hypothetical protein
MVHSTPTNNNISNDDNDNTNDKDDISSLSYERRQKIQQQITIPIVSNFFPIERYYDAADKVYTELQQTSLLVQREPESKLLSITDIPNDEPLVYNYIFNDGLNMCYMYGRRYCMFCIDAIPTHHYYNTIKYKQLQNKHIQQIDKVLRLLEYIVQQMNVQEYIRYQIQQQQEKQQELLLIQRHQQLLSSSQQQQQPSSSTSTTSLQESAMEKLKLLMPSPPPSQPTSSSSRYRLPDDDENDNDNDTTNIPNHPIVSLNGIKPLLPPSSSMPSSSSTTSTNSNNNGDIVTPPSYEAVISAMQRKNHIQPQPRPEQRPEQPLPTTTTTKDNDHDTTNDILLKLPKKPKLPFRQLQEYYNNMYNTFLQNKTIQISTIKTYQGRISKSTNGCTVISALIVAKHLEDMTQYSCISNSSVERIIDVECGPILQTIRSKLGLNAFSLIIPSDVHDHLVDCHILHQSTFLGAAGGNILYEQHYTEFLSLLINNNNNNSDTKSNGKAGATLFFREHVISIIKSMDRTTNEYYYDLIDSMPNMVLHGKNYATRTRCTTIQSLYCLLLYYATRKLSNSNNIDHLQWDDTTADIDPRVFQGFVWST